MKKKLLLSTLIVFSLVISGCNFFGKQTEETETTDPTVLTNGASVLGTWIFSYANTSANRNPNLALTSGFEFTANGNVRVFYKEGHDGGIYCEALGVYRNVNKNDFVVYLQTVNNAQCAFSGTMVLSGLKVTGSLLTYTDPDSGETYSYFAKRTSTPTLEGLWDFHGVGGDNGDGGIDFIYIDSYGYFVLQSRDGSDLFLLVGRYTVRQGAIKFEFFDNLNPNQISGQSLDFNQFVTNGSQLELIQITSQGSFSYIGDRL